MQTVIQIYLSEISSNEFITCYNSNDNKSDKIRK